MDLLAALVVFLAVCCFCAGAIGLSARIAWDQAGKAALVLALLLHIGPGLR